MSVYFHKRKIQINNKLISILRFQNFRIVLSLLYIIIMWLIAEYIYNLFITETYCSSPYTI